MPPLRAVILDIDGTLLDSNDAHTSAFVDAARELGIAADYEKIRRLIGKGGDKLIPEAFGFAQESDRGEALDGRKGEIFRERYLPQLHPTPGARALLERLRDEGLKRVVATSASKEDLEGLLERAGIADLVGEATSASDVEETKPAPEPVQAALEQAGCEPAEAVMLGDTPYDVESALRAGVRIVGVRSGGWNDEELRGAAAVYDDPADLLRSFRTSPLAPDSEPSR
jgi:HAD superfamily hydrolase (TIGR01509 family)